MDAGRPKAVKAFGMGDTLKIDPYNFNLGGAFDIGVLLRDRKAAFLVGVQIF